MAVKIFYKDYKNLASNDSWDRRLPKGGVLLREPDQKDPGNADRKKGTCHVKSLDASNQPLAEVPHNCLWEAEKLVTLAVKSKPHSEGEVDIGQLQ